jgi:poly(beta-D-mannuronate) lyase
MTPREEFQNFTTKSLVMKLLNRIRNTFCLLMFAVTSSTLSSQVCWGETIAARHPSELVDAMKRARPGDEVVLSEGEWRDAELRINGEGTAAAPITVRAAVPGKTILTGASRVRLSGSHLVLKGLWLRNPENSQFDWLEFRYDSKRLATHCTVTDCVFTEDAEFKSIDKESRWIGIYGEANRLTSCRIEGKKNKGTTVVVWLGDSNKGRHVIASNYFGTRPRLGKNGGETIRIGDSNTSMQSAQCLVEKNLFENCDGETECISNKSCENVYRSNTFRNVKGTLTLRHGNGCLVEGNVFLGNKTSQTGGIRIIGEDHRVLNNHLQDLEGDGFRTAIAILNGYPDSKLNGYFPVKRAVIEGNVMVNCKHSLLLGYNDESKANVVPSDCVFISNTIVARKGQPAIEVASMPQASRFEGNRIQADILGMDAVAGIEMVQSIDVKSPRALTQEAVGPPWK